MQTRLARNDKKLVTIVDPHIKRSENYDIHREMKNNHYVKTNKGYDFEGHCWPGSSS